MTHLPWSSLAAQQVCRWAKPIVSLPERLSDNEPPIVNAAYLRQLPEGTFGRIWIDTMDQAGLMPFSSGSRRQQLHDGVHVLMGYRVDPLGEAQVQAFLVGSKFKAWHGVMLSQLVMTVALVRPVEIGLYGDPGRKLTLAEVWKAVSAAYCQGRQVRLDIDHWQPEALWELPYAEVQAMFGVS